MNELNAYDVTTEQANAAIARTAAGKTISTIQLVPDYTDDVLRIEFTDGSKLTVRSWDYEGYRSGMYVYEGEGPPLDSES